MEYITISTLANAQYFGDTNSATNSNNNSTSNSTNERGLFILSTDSVKNMDYITINSASNGTDFGDLTDNRSGTSATSNYTNERGVIGGGRGAAWGDEVNVIDYITINSASNATDFGDLQRVKWTTGATSNGENEMGMWIGGAYDAAKIYVNEIEYVTINTLGNATDFGNITQSRRGIGSVSNA